MAKLNSAALRCTTPGPMHIFTTRETRLACDALLALAERSERLGAPAQAPAWADAEAAACALQAVAPVGVTLFRTEDLVAQ